MSNRIVIFVTLFILLLTIYISLNQQTASAHSHKILHFSDTAMDKPAEQEFKNIQVLKGMPASKIHIVMRFMANSLGVRCDYCHVTADSGPWPMEKDDKPTKLKARDMIVMMNQINQNNFEGKQEVNCATCHNGNSKPISVPPLFHEPTEVAVNKDSLPDVNTIIDKYVNAIGGRNAFEKITTKVVKGEVTLRNGKKQQVEIYQSAPDKYLYSVTTEQGKFINGYNGQTGWVKDPRHTGEMEPDELADIKREAVFNKEVSFDKIYSNMKVRGISIIDNHKAYQVSGSLGDDDYARLYFDTDSGLLLKTIIYKMNPFGAIPEETSYDDYRTVEGVKIPFSVNERGVTYNQVFKVSEVKLNSPIEEQNYNMPAEVH